MRRPDPFFTALNCLLGWNQHPRNGKVARLPEPTRTRINQMLENGLPYRAIIRHLNETETLPYPLSEMNLSNWFQGGYQDYLRAHLTNEAPQQPKLYRLNQTITAPTSDPTAPNRSKPDPI